MEGWGFEHPCAQLLLRATESLSSAAHARALDLYGEVVREKHARDVDVPLGFRMGRFDTVFAHIPSFVEARTQAITEVCGWE